MSENPRMFRHDVACSALCPVFARNFGLTLVFHYGGYIDKKHIVDRMTKTREVRFRVTRSEHDRINSIARSRGFSNVSAYMRAMCLERDLWLEKKVQAMHTILTNLEKILKN